MGSKKNSLRHWMRCGRNAVLASALIVAIEALVIAARLKSRMDLDNMEKGVPLILLLITGASVTLSFQMLLS